MDGTGTNSTRKLVILGGEATGKSALARRFCKNEFAETGKESTEKGYVFGTRSVNGVEFEVWDTTGASSAAMYYRDADVVLVVIDLTSPGSIATARTIVVELRQSAEDSLLIGLVSNKSDQLAEEITEAEAHLLAKEEALLSFDCSAKTGQGVEEILANLAKRLSSPAPAVNSSALRKPRIPSTRGVTPSPASPAPHAPSSMQSSAYATGGIPAVPASQKAQNETYFASMGSANNARSAELSPSEGGRYAGFGSDSSYNPSSATSSRALPTLDDFNSDPAGALGRGWGFMTAAIGALSTSVNESVVQPTLERAVDPTLQSQFSSYFSSAGEALSSASRRGGEALASGLQSSGEVIRRDLGYDVGDLGASTLERFTGRGAGEGYGRIGSSSAPPGGEADELERGASDMSSTSSSRNETPIGSYREDSPAPNLAPTNRTSLPPRNGPPRSEVRRGSAQKDGEGEEWGKEW